MTRPSCCMFYDIMGVYKLCILLCLLNIDIKQTMNVNNVIDVNNNYFYVNSYNSGVQE